MAALLVGLVLGLVAGALFSGLCFWLIRAFPLRDDDVPVAHASSPLVGRVGQHRRGEPPDYRWVVAWPGLPPRHARTATVHLRRREVA